LNGTSVKTFTDDTDYNYTDGLYIGSGRDGSGFRQGYIRFVRVSTEAKYTEEFSAITSLPYVAIGDTYSYLDKTYKWSGVKWFDRSKFNANIPGEYQNYAAYTASSNTTTIDVSSANFVEVDLVGGQDTEFVFTNEALEQNLLMKVNDGTVITGYDLENASYDNVSFGVVSQDTIPRGMTFKPDGTKMYIVGDASDTIYQYTLSTPWDLSSTSYDSVSFSVAGQDTTPYDVTFNQDGTKMYMVGITNDRVNEYNLSTAWDVSTASYLQTFSVSSQETNPSGLFFKPDGTKMYVIGLGNDAIYQYTLSTAWDVSTASYDNVSFSVASDEGLPVGITFKPDGTKMYMVGITNDTIYQYALSTAWDVSTASYDNVSFSVASEDSSPFKSIFKSDGTKMYILGFGNDTVYQYSTTGTTNWPPTWPSNVTWSTGSAPTISSTTLIEFNKYNGIWHGNVISENL
jgi:sugar lactone lactonase YvrE